MKRGILFALSFVILITRIQSHSTIKQFKDFGMNKPHLLFHLGDRKSVSVNYGIGYWLNNKKPSNKNYFTKSRLWYENSNNGLYVNMISHDGDSHIHQKIEDSTFNVQTNIKYQLLEDGWEQQYTMEKTNPQENRYINHSLYWFNYMTVQNNDPQLVDHKEYSTSVQFNILEQGQNDMIVKVERLNQDSQMIHVRSKEKLKVFGFSMNISESYDVRHFMEEIKHLIQLERYKDVKRRNDTKLVEWENGQVKLIKSNQWTNNKFVILVFYGECKNGNTIYIGNRTLPFDEVHFDKTSQRLNSTYFPMQQYPQHSDFLRHIIFNLYGGSAFYYGVLYTQNSLLKHELDYSYTFTPSRLIFPRGFLWDDGFHLSVALHYDPQKTLNVIHNWLRKIDLFGWIGRQQIRGYQMSSLMPQIKFVYQDIFQMNPPTLIMPIISLIEKAIAGELNEETEQNLKLLMEQNYWKIEKWYRYFVKTQSHNNLMEAEAVNRSLKYRWRCKDDCQRGNFMGSGLDDYPRTATQTQISKQHVDLMSWIYFFSEGLEKIANYLKLQKPQKYYRSKKEVMKRKIIDQCLDKTDLLFKDQSAAAKNQFVDELVSKVGYINLFPFFTGILKEEEYEEGQRQKIIDVRKKIISVIGDTELLLSEDGIRSLSISDPLYGTLDNYWRGAVWLPINFMVLRACKKYYWADEQVRNLYHTVRQKLIKSVKSNWQNTGYLYENYHEGKGNRGFPFYGWTSLMVNIITQRY